jgi:NitT/TauT family transport system ATP-binding protein
MSESFIHLADVRKTFKTRKDEFLAISEVTFDVKAGELVSIVGPSGCGKTTILKVLAGIHSYEGGTVRIGSEANPFDPSKDIGMVFQPIFSEWSVCKALKINIPMSFPAACSSAPPSPVR